jgi:hypothetical protein
VFPSHLFLAEDVSSPLRCSPIAVSSLPGATATPGVDVSTPEAASGAAHDRASCELHDPMASLRAVDSFSQLAIKLWPAKRRLDAERHSRIKSWRQGHQLLVLIDVSRGGRQEQFAAASATSAAIVNRS